MSIEKEWACAPPVPWLMLSLSALLLLACKPQPVLCEAKAYFQPVNAKAGSAAQLESASFLNGALLEVPRYRVQSRPELLRFQDASHLTAFWVSFGHVNTEVELVFSQSDSKALAATNAGATFPMIRQAQGGADRIRFGFDSPLCSDPEAVTNNGGFCRQYQDKSQPLVAELVCAREQPGR